MKKKQLCKRTAAWLLASAMVLSGSSVSAFAEEAGEDFAAEETADSAEVEFEDEAEAAVPEENSVEAVTAEDAEADLFTSEEEAPEVGDGEKTAGTVNVVIDGNECELVCGSGLEINKSYYAWISNYDGNLWAVIIDAKVISSTTQNSDDSTQVVEIETVSGENENKYTVAHAKALGTATIQLTYTLQTDQDGSPSGVPLSDEFAKQYGISKTGTATFTINSVDTKYRTDSLECELNNGESKTVTTNLIKETYTEETDVFARNAVSNYTIRIQENSYSKYITATAEGNTVTIKTIQTVGEDTMFLIPIEYYVSGAKDPVCTSPIEVTLRASASKEPDTPTDPTDPTDPTTPTVESYKYGSTETHYSCKSGGSFVVSTECKGVYSDGTEKEVDSYTLEVNNDSSDFTVTVNNATLTVTPNSGIEPGKYSFTYNYVVGEETVGADTIDFTVPGTTYELRADIYGTYEDRVLVKGQTKSIVSSLDGWTWDENGECEETTNDGLTLTYASDDEDVAEVDENGNITAIGVGNTVIKVTALINGESVATYPIGVTVVDVSYKLTASVPALDNLDEGEMIVGDTANVEYSLEAALPSGSTTYEPKDYKVVCTSSKPEVAEVSSGGKITAKSKGTTTITVSAYVGNEKEPVATRPVKIKVVEAVYEIIINNGKELYVDPNDTPMTVPVKVVKYTSEDRNGKTVKIEDGDLNLVNWSEEFISAEIKNGSLVLTQTDEQKEKLGTARQMVHVVLSYKTIISADESITLHVHKYTESVKAATCTTQGTTTYTCECGYTYTKTTPALGHTAGVRDGKYVKPTCITEGSKELVNYCTRCGVTLGKETKKIPKIAHSNAGYVTDENVELRLVGSRVVDDGVRLAKAGNSPAKDANGNTVNWIGSYSQGDVPAFMVEAQLITRCSMCGGNERELTTGYSKPTITVIKVTPESALGKTGSISLRVSYMISKGIRTGNIIFKEVTVPYYTSYEAYKAAGGKEVYSELRKDSDGVYRYYVGGALASNYTGLVDYKGEKFYVTKGVLDKKINELYLVGGTWYYFIEGQVASDYTGLVLYDGEWFYVANGVMDASKTGLIDYDGGTFLFIDGRLATEVNGLWENTDGTWYYLALGQVQAQYTGIAFYDGATFYVEKGKLISNYNGTTVFQGHTFNVVNGQVYGPID